MTQKESVDYHVYALYTNIQGVFYIGSGKGRRYQRSRYHSGKRMSVKDYALDYFKRKDIKVKSEIIFSTPNRQEALNYEQFIIQSYGGCLVNRKGFKSNPNMV